VWNKVKEGRPLDAPRTAWQKITGADPESRLADEEVIYADIAKFLTGPRGYDGLNALQNLEAAYKAGTLNKATAEKIGQLLMSGADLSAYQFSTQELRK
jgi:hypothetical protein